MAYNQRLHDLFYTKILRHGGGSAEIRENLGFLTGYLFHVGDKVRLNSILPGVYAVIISKNIEGGGVRVRILDGERAGEELDVAWTSLVPHAQESRRTRTRKFLREAVESSFGK